MKGKNFKNNVQKIPTINGKTYLKAFISGFVFVSFIVTFIVFLAQIARDINLLVSEITLAALIFGAWNMFYFFIYYNLNLKIRIGWWGAILGFLFGVGALLRPETHITHSDAIGILLENTVNFEAFNFIFHTLSIIWLPILYFFLWHYVIKWLNNLWGCKCD